MGDHTPGALPVTSFQLGGDEAIEESPFDRRQLSASRYDSTSAMRSLTNTSDTHIQVAQQAGRVLTIAITFSIGFIGLLLGGTAVSEAAPDQTEYRSAQFDGTRDFIVLYRKNVELGPRLSTEVRKGNEVEDRFTSSINGAVLELQANDVNRLREDERVLVVEPDRRVSITSQTRTTQPPSWGLDRINQRGLPLDGSIARGRNNGAGVEVYVIDTGIDQDHGQFSGRLNPESFSAYGTPDDCNGHGTHVAGTAAGSTYGVAPGARLTAVRVLACDGEGWSSDILKGIDWMISDHLADGQAGRRASADSRTEAARPGDLRSPSSKTTEATQLDEPGNEVSSTDFGSGSIENLRSVSSGSQFEFRISATANVNICQSSGYCGWYPVAFVFPRDRQCAPSYAGGAFAWVGNTQSQPGTQTASRTVSMPGSAPWRFCVYASTSEAYHLIHETVLSPGQSDPVDPGLGRPTNDDFSARQELQTLDATVSTTVNATAEPGEPTHHGSQARASVWYRWVAPSDGILSLSTSSSSFDTTLAAYSGASLSSLSRVASDNGSGSNSRISTRVNQGTTYSIAIDGFGGATGVTRLGGTFSPLVRPTNDDFESRQALASLQGISGSTVDATAEPGEPAHYGSQAYSSIWYQWTAPASGNLTVTTSGSSFDTVLAAYSGSALTTLTQLARNDDSDGSRTSRITIPVTSGTTYSLAIDGWNGATGTTRISGSFAPPTPDPGQPGDPGEPGDPGNPGDPGTPSPQLRSAVANLSLGGLRSESTNLAIQRAVGVGITVVVAAGNESDDACSKSPASAPNALTVASSNVTDGQSWFSNSGPCVDLFAPGEEIVSAWHQSGRKTETLSGTSMASPHVAGAAALLLGRNPALTPADVSREILGSATRDVLKGVDSSTPNLLLNVPGVSPPQVSAPEGDIPTGSKSNAATVTVSGSDSGSYECSLNGGQWQACRPGALRYGDLALGRHEFRLRGTVDGEPIPESTHTWRYVPVAPTITKGPRKGSSRKALFRFTRIEGFRTECKLDRRTWKVCKSPTRYRGLKPGKHVFRVRQVSGDLVSPTAKRVWRITKRR